MSRSTGEVGRKAEGAVAKRLRRNGLRILTRNFRWPRGEVDIVALDGAVYVFVEVRARGADSTYRPAETVRRAKQRTIRRTAQAYFHQHGLGEPACRFDVAEVYLDDRQRPARIDIVENAF